MEEFQNLFKPEIDALTKECQNNYLNASKKFDRSAMIAMACIFGVALVVYINALRSARKTEL